MKSLLITGGAGFIGSNFIFYMLAKHRDIRIVNLDALTYAGNLSTLSPISNDPRYSFVKGNICDRTLLDALFNKFQFDTVVNFAAESHVDRSIVEPDIFLSTNIIGTQALLHIAKRHWNIEPDNKYCRVYRSGVKFLQVSTDEVYGTLGSSGMFVEEMPLLPNSPYSASKASADLIVRAYHETYGLPINITRCSNNYGAFQFPEKLIPLMIHNCMLDKKLPVYGDGMQIRDWLYVEDHCSAIDTVICKGIDGHIYNIGGNNEKPNIEVVKTIISALGKDNSLIEHVKDRPGHDRRYAIDNTKITTQLGWTPEWTFESGMAKTIDWYQNNQAWTDKVTSGEYLDYYEKMYLQN
ncbi:MAG: dTDP-glucose 4,6-dehydratase [Defluviitaleaceae bacterium]|nr:dTDP-glucose 4,6-dehydratase [Defluviitaleaceae bacterium]